MTLERPIVMIIEIPEQDPDYIAIGDVEVDYISAYPTTHYASVDVEAGAYDDYPEDMRAAAARYDKIDAPGAREAADYHRILADRFETTHATYLARHLT